MGRAWKTAAIVVALFAIPRCSCNGCDDRSSATDCSTMSAPPHATYVLQQGCGGEYCALQCESGFVDCNDSTDDGCETAMDLTALHEVATGDTYGAGGGGGCGGGGGGPVTIHVGNCTFECAPGWSDCDGNAATGCETPTPPNGSCFPSFTDAKVDAPPTPTRILTLNDGSLGLAACAGSYYVLDGTDVRAIDSVTLVAQSVATSPGLPAGGLACDGLDLYWTTIDGGDAGPAGGQLVRMDLATTTVDVVAGGFDPGPGIDVRGAVAYFLARSGVGNGGPTLAAASLDDGGLASWMPAMETPTYKVFALGVADDWSLAGGAVYRRPLDGGAFAWLDAGAASALVTNADGQAFAVVHAPDDAGAVDASDDAADAAAPTDYFASLADDAGAPRLIAIPGTEVHRVVATASGALPLAASDDAVYGLALPDGGVTVFASSASPVAQVATDGAWVVWTTRATGTEAAGVWRIAGK
jgi:hypothetical protein